MLPASSGARVLSRGRAAFSQFQLIASGSVRDAHATNTFINFVPQQEAWVVERMGKFYRILEPGLNVLIPVIDRIKHVQSLKEIAIEIPKQGAITMDNVHLQLDGVLYLRVFDPYKASYGVDDPEFAVTQLAQTTMRSEVGKMSLDEVFKERERLNIFIVEAINKAAEAWGISCMRYEIKDMTMPTKIQEAMQMQVEAERRKRAAILESEGERDAQVNRAMGEANALKLSAEARAKAIERVTEALNKAGGERAASLALAERYVDAFGKIAKEGNTLIVPASIAEPASLVSQALGIYNKVAGELKTKS